MKKIMTILLSLTMCFCFVCTNADSVKAETNTCSGLTLTKSGGDYYWGNGGTSISEDDLTDYGIEWNKSSISIKFTEDLSTNGAVTTLETGSLVSPLTIEISKDITITNSNNMPIISSYDTGFQLIIKGNGHKLKLVGSGGQAVDTMHLKLIDVDLEISNDCSWGSSLLCSLDLTMDENSSLTLVNSNGPAFQVSNSWIGMDLPSGYELLGSTNASPTEADLSVPALGVNYYYYVGSNVAKYIIIRKIKPQVAETTVTSVPAPAQVKDESCEAVIGPRWHWNNTKGICEEEYSVINTATK